MNGYSVKTSALADSGANGFVFINTSCAYDIAKFLNLKAQRLPTPINVKGYDGNINNSITHYIRLHLTVDGRRQYNLPLLILDTGAHDCILGRKWLALLNVLVDCRRSCLKWPDSLRPSYSVVKEIQVDRRTLIPMIPTQSHQDDVYARDQAFKLEDQRRAGGRAGGRAPNTLYQTTIESPSSNSSASDISDSDGTSQKGASNSDTEFESEEPKSTLSRRYEWDQANNLRKMDESLRGFVRIKGIPYQKKSYEPATKRQDAPVDISIISAVGFHYNLR